MAAMLPDGRRLGAHLALGDGMVKAAERAVEIGLDALQVFSDNPTAWQRGPSPTRRSSGSGRSSTSTTSRRSPSTART